MQATSDLFFAPPYPGNGVSAADARLWLAHKVGIDLSGVARYADPNLLLRQAIENYGAYAVAGRAPDGRVERMCDVYERTVAPWNVPRLKPVKRGTPKRRAW